MQRRRWHAGCLGGCAAACTLSVHTDEHFGFTACPPASYYLCRRVGHHGVCCHQAFPGGGADLPASLHWRQGLSNTVWSMAKLGAEVNLEVAELLEGLAQEAVSQLGDERARAKFIPQNLSNMCGPCDAHANSGAVSKSRSPVPLLRIQRETRTVGQASQGRCCAHTAASL